MKLLLDTHVFIWWANEPDRLSSTALSACQDSDNTLALSVASVWEMQIKMQLGKLKLNNALGALIKEQQQVNGLQVITVELDHASWFGIPATSSQGSF